MIARKVKSILEDPSSGVIRRMFEEGALLKKKYGEDKVYDFSLGNPSIEPPNKVYEIIKSIAQENGKNAHGYMANAGYKEARKAIANKVSAEQETPLSFNNVVMSCGAAGALNCIFKSILNKEDEVIVPSPYFSEYKHYVNNYEGVLKPVETREDFSLDIRKIKEAISPKTHAILLNSPNNPTGRIYSKEDIFALTSLLNECNKSRNIEEVFNPIYLIIDEPYRAITYDGKEVPAIFPLYPYSIIASSFAKDLSLPGERIGYVAVNPANSECDTLISAIILATRILGFVNAPAFFQRVIVNAYNAKVDYSQYKVNRDLLASIMDEVGLTYILPEGAFYLFVKVPNKWQEDDSAFCEYLKSFNILAAPGAGFGKKGWARFAFCVPEKTIKNSRTSFINALK